MKILRAFGFGALLIVIAVFMPPVLSELSKTLVVLLKSSAQVFSAAAAIASQAAHIR